MKTLKILKSTAIRTVTNEYFPATAVLAGVILFWGLGLFGGLSLLSDHQSVLATLSWLLFVYAAAVLTPIAGLVAVVDLSRRWLRNRASGVAGPTEAAEVYCPQRGRQPDGIWGWGYSNRDGSPMPRRTTSATPLE